MTMDLHGRPFARQVDDAIGTLEGLGVDMSDPGGPWGRTLAAIEARRAASFAARGMAPLHRGRGRCANVPEDALQEVAEACDWLLAVYAAGAVMGRLTGSPPREWPEP